MEMDKNGSREYTALVVTGPTASGKTRVAAEMAYILKGEVISADSRQVYKSMDIGTGKDLSDYFVNGSDIKVHLTDVAEPGTKFNLFEFNRAFSAVYSDLIDRGVFPVICGGSGLYVDSIVSGYRIFEVPPDPELRQKLEDKTLDELSEILASYRPLHNVTDLDTTKRAVRAIEIEEYRRIHQTAVNEMPAIKPLVTGILYDRESRRKRITERLKQRLENGLCEEIESLLQSGIPAEDLIYYGLEYKYVTQFVTGKLSYSEMYSILETAIHQFAKRQMTWFRGMERRGVKIHWIDGNLSMEQKIHIILELLESKDSG